MPNKIFNTVVEELDFVGDILSVGITKKAVLKQGTTPDDVNLKEMKAAMDDHIVPALYDFISEKKAERWKKDTLEKIKRKGIR